MSDEAEGVEEAPEVAFTPERDGVVSVELSVPSMDDDVAQRVVAVAYLVQIAGQTREPRLIDLCIDTVQAAVHSIPRAKPVAAK